MSSGTLLVNSRKTTTSVETEKTAARSCRRITRSKKRAAARRSKSSTCSTLKEGSKSMTIFSGWSASREKLAISCGTPSSRISKSSCFKLSEALDGLPASVTTTLTRSLLMRMVSSLSFPPFCFCRGRLSGSRIFGVAPGGLGLPGVCFFDSGCCPRPLWLKTARSGVNTRVTTARRSASRTVWYRDPENHIGLCGSVVNSLFIYAPRISAKMIDRIERWLLGEARLRRSRDLSVFVSRRRERSFHDRSQPICADACASVSNEGVGLTTYFSTLKDSKSTSKCQAKWHSAWCHFEVEGDVGGGGIGGLDNAPSGHNRIKQLGGVRLGFFS